MQLVILAGGRGTRISEESFLKPKPLIEIGGKPIILHIMDHYSFYGIKEFIICCGYKGELLKEYFSKFWNICLRYDSKFKKYNKIKFHKKKFEDWKVTLIDTGIDTQTGGRIKKIKNYVKSTFCLTYGDGISNVNILESIKFHKNNKKLATMTTVQPAGRFGAVEIEVII